MCMVFLLAIAFLVAPVAADKYVVTSSSNAPVAGTVVTISAQLSSDAGVANATAGNVVTWSKTNTTGSFSSVTSTTDANGIATVTFTTGTVAGTVYTITGTDASSSTGTSAAITTVAGAATQIAKNAGDGQTASVSTAVTMSPSVIVKDVYDNPVSGQSVTFVVASGGGSVSVSSAITGSNGIATEGSWTLGPAAGSNTLTATSGTLTVTFTATATAVTTTTTTPAINSTTNGSIYVKSNPSISKIFLDSVFQGYTPMTLENVTPITHTVMVRSAGYNEYSESVTVTPGNTSYLTASLVLAPEVTTATTVPTTTVTTVRTTAKSTVKVPTPWPSATTTTPASPVSIIAILGAVGAGFIILRKK